MIRYKLEKAEIRNNSNNVSQKVLNPNIWITLENKRATDAGKRCLKEWKVDDRTCNSSC